MHELGPLLWQQQETPASLLVSAKQYYWWLPCRVHLRFLSVQAVVRQANKNKDGVWELLPCERCSCSYRTVGPEPNTDEKGTSSFFAQCCWKWLEHELIVPDVLLKMQSMPYPANMLVGADLGYVVEAKVVTGWKGAVDVYVPALQLAVQVDGQHHHGGAQQTTDLRFMKVAHEQHINVLRLWYADLHSMPQDIRSMVHECIARFAAGRKPAVIKCSRSHPLCNDPWYISVNDAM